MSSDLTLSIDIGSSSVRAALYTHAGKMLRDTLARRETAFSSIADGGSEFDAAKLFDTVVRTIDEVLERSRDVNGDIAIVAWCGFWHSLVCVDERGRPVMPALSWADTRSKRHTTMLRQQLDEASVHQRTGAHFHSSYWPAKVSWLTGERTAQLPTTPRFLSFTDYAGSRLFGDSSTSVSMASATGLMNIRTCEWDAELLTHLRLDADMLPVIADDDKTFMLTRKWAKRWPRLADAKWAQALGDGAANNIGTGCVTRQRATLMIGTSGAIRVTYTGDPPDEMPDGLWCYRIDRRRVVMGGALSDGGDLFDHLKASLRIDLSNKKVGREMAKRGADAHGITCMPFFYGERSTGYHEDAVGAFHGLTPSHDAIDILQSAIESIAYRFAEIFDRLDQVTRIKEIVVSGGAIQAIPVWRQITADVLGRDIEHLRAGEASMRGAVLLALESIGKIDSISKVRTDTERIEHHPKCHAIYTNARRRHLEYYDRIQNDRS